MLLNFKENHLRKSLFFTKCLTLLVVLFSEAVYAKSPIENYSVEQYQEALRGNANKAIWFYREQLTAAGRQLLSVSIDLDLLPILESRLSKKQVLQKKHINQVDFLLSQALFRLVALSHVKLKGVEFQNLFTKNIRNNSLSDWLTKLTPQHPLFERLRLEIATLKRLPEDNWLFLENRFTPILGQQHVNIYPIKLVLNTLGFLTDDELKDDRKYNFNATTLNSIKLFQRVHGLIEDGVVGPKTYKALRLSPRERIRIIKSNLKRLLLLPNPLPDKYILVNIPSYQLTLVEKSIEKLAMKVIVGTKNTPTPEMITIIDGVTINPSWTPPFSIIKSELAEQYKSDYLSLKRRNFQLIKGSGELQIVEEIDQPNLNLIKMMLEYRLVQAPGINNALGLFRFNLVNKHFIFIHDTPSKELFAKNTRALSHGCIRVEKAQELAHYLFNTNMDANKIMPFDINQTETKHIRLAEPIPVFIIYLTSWLGKNGELQLLPDIYGLD